MKEVFINISTPEEYSFIGNKIENEKSIDKSFWKYLLYISTQTNKEYFEFVFKFIVLFICIILLLYFSFLLFFFLSHSESNVRYFCLIHHDLEVLLLLPLLCLNLLLMLIILCLSLCVSVVGYGVEFHLVVLGLCCLSVRCLCIIASVLGVIVCFGCQG